MHRQGQFTELASFAKDSIASTNQGKKRKQKKPLKQSQQLLCSYATVHMLK